MTDVRRAKGPERLDEATLLVLTEISHRTLTRWRQQGLVRAVEPRHGLGLGLGTTPLRYPASEVPKIHRLKELKRQFKKVAERRWRLWLEGYSVRIATNLADTLTRRMALAPKIKTLDDIEAALAADLWDPTNMPRGNPWRVICRGLSRRDQHSLTTMLICVALGIRLPLFDEPDPYPFQVFKRALGLPKEWLMPSGLFDIFPFMREQIVNALLRATTEELKSARAFLAHLLDNPENWSCGAIVAGGAPLPSRLIKLARLMWPSLVVRAATVGFVILVMRGIKSVLREIEAALSSIVSKIVWPEPA